MIAIVSESNCTNVFGGSSHSSRSSGSGHLEQKVQVAVSNTLRGMSTVDGLRKTVAKKAHTKRVNTRLAAAAKTHDENFHLLRILCIQTLTEIQDDCHDFAGGCMKQFVQCLYDQRDHM